MTEVRPPTQSSIGKRLSQPSASAVLSSREPVPVTATAWGANSSPFFLKKSWATSMPLRVSGVPPDLEMTMTSVSSRGEGFQHPVHAVRIRVVQKEHVQPCRRNGIRHQLRAKSGTADADDEGGGILFRAGRRYFAVQNVPSEGFDVRQGPSMAAFNSGVGAREELRSQ